MSGFTKNLHNQGSDDRAGCAFRLCATIAEVPITRIHTKSKAGSNNGKCMSAVNTQLVFNVWIPVDSGEQDK